MEPEVPEANFNIGGTTTIDVLQKGFNKAVGLKRLIKKLGFEKKDLLFVGDGLFLGGNDYSVYEAGFETIKVEGPDQTTLIIQKWFE